MHIVFQIHGTWGRRAFFRRPMAEWCADDSHCQQSISRALGDNTVFHPLNWSGDNSTKARLGAAEQLADCLRLHKQRHPTAKLHVLAHSHAGNIAMYALKEPQVASLVSSLICLSTPFLHTSPRQLGAKLGKRLEFLASIAVVTVALAAAVVAISSFWPKTASVLLGLLRHDFALFALLPIGLCLWLATRYLLIPMWRRLHDNAHRYCERMRLPSSLPFPVLLVRAAADEASSALGAVQLFSWLLTRLVRLLSVTLPLDIDDKSPAVTEGKRTRRPLPRSIRLGTSIMGIAILLPLVIFLLASIGVDLRMSPDLLALLMLLLFLLGPIIMIWADLVAFAVMCAVAMLSSALAVVLLCFGWRQSAATALSTNISAEPTPPGRWDLVQLGHSNDPLETQRTLNHATHSSPSALAVVEAWMRERFGVASTMENVTQL